MLHNTMLETGCLVRPRFLIWGKRFDDQPMERTARKLASAIIRDSKPIDLHGAPLAVVEECIAGAVATTAMDALKRIHTKKHPTQADKWMMELPYVAVFVDSAKDYRRFNVRVFLYDNCMGTRPGYEIADIVFDYRPNATVKVRDNNAQED